MLFRSSAGGVLIQRDGTTIGTVGGNTTTFNVRASTGVTTANLIDTNATTINFANVATDISIGSVAGGSNTYLKNATTNVSGTLTAAGTINANNGTIATTQSTFSLINANATTVNFAGAATDISVGSASGNLYLKNATTNISGSLVVAGAANLNGSVTLGDATIDNITFTGRMASSILPSADVTYDLGSANLRWRNMYTGDLHLRNDRGDWTIIEEAEYLSITNNLSGKRYKFVLEEI